MTDEVAKKLYKVNHIQLSSKLYDNLKSFGSNAKIIKAQGRSLLVDVIALGIIGGIAGEQLILEITNVGEWFK